jgi:hypothetical protein
MQLSCLILSVVLILLYGEPCPIIGNDVHVSVHPPVLLVHSCCNRIMFYMVWLYIGFGTKKGSKGVGLPDTGYRFGWAKRLLLGNRSGCVTL